MAVAQRAAKHRLAIRELAEGIPDTRKAEDPEFVLRAMGALALFDNFKWIIIGEGHKLNLVTADASDVWTCGPRGAGDLKTDGGTHSETGAQAEGKNRAPPDPCNAGRVCLGPGKCQMDA